jgi:hypothetical protein
LATTSVEVMSIKKKYKSLITKIIKSKFLKILRKKMRLN